MESLLSEHLQVLVDYIGERPGGSPGDHRAAAYIHGVFVEAGWEVEEQRFDCPAWTHHDTRLTLNGNQLPAAANAYSPACNLTAETMGVGTIAELEVAHLDGSIAVLYGDLMPGPLSPKSWFLKSEREDKVIRLLEEKQPIAVLTVQHHRGGLERLIEDWEFRIPSATITPASALALLGEGQQVARLRIESEQSPGYSANIVARSPSRAKRVILCAHFDTKIDTPGALDNASGTAVLLALAQTLKTADYPYGLEFVAFTNEEYMPIGDDEYLRRGGEDFDDVIVAINVDSVGQRLAANSIALFSASSQFENALQGITAAYPGVVWVDPWPQSNHSTFAMRGVPSIAFSSTGRIELAHWPDDDLRWIDSARVGDIVRLIADILTLLGKANSLSTREGD
jgi:aminopeptidase YwaD